MLWYLYDGKVGIKIKWVKTMLYVKKEKDLKKFFPRLPASVSSGRKFGSTFFTLICNATKFFLSV